MGSPVRVLHVVVNMNRGGAETLIMNLYRNIDRNKVQFDFLTCKKGVFDKEIEAMGGNIHRIPYITEAGHFGYIKQLEQFFKTHSHYKIVHAHMDKMSGIVLRAAKKAGVPVRIAHSHNTESEGGFTSKLYKWYAGQAIRTAATHQYACSQAAAKWLFKSKAKRAFILKNGIETDKFHFSPEIRAKVRKELEIEDNTLVVGHVGRFNQQKNHLFLLDVFADLTKTMPHTLLLLAGDGPLRPAIEQRIKQLNIKEKVKLLGIREDINSLLQAFDVFVFPSVHEGLPVTLIEAQGAGLPCVISGAITHEVDMGLGLVQYLPISNPKIWSEKVAELTQRTPNRMGSGYSLLDKGYDIRETAATTQTSYLMLGRQLI